MRVFYREHGHDPLSESDPGINILQSQNNVSFLSKYYRVKDFNMKLDQIKNNLSLLNANIRSIPCNLKEGKLYQL